MEYIKRQYKAISWIITHAQRHAVELAVLAVLTVQLVFPQASVAAQTPLSEVLAAAENRSVMVDTVRFAYADVTNRPDLSREFYSLPLAERKQPKRVMWVTVTAYSSTPDQTDSTPCITADGFNVCEHNQENVIAANFLRFGTMVKMPEEFGDRIFTVHDRMNPRYQERVDIWMKSREAAKQFGVKRVKIEIY